MNPSSHHSHHSHHHQHHNQSGGGNSYLQHPPQPSGSLTKGGGPKGNGGNGMPYMEESGGARSQGPQHGHGGGHPTPIQPPPGWKSHHLNPHHQHPMSGNGNCSPSSSISSNYGASHNYLQQSFYTPPLDPHGGSDGSIGHPGQNPANYSPVHNTPSPCPYYPPEQQQHGPTDYYHQHPQAQAQFNTFDPKNRRPCPNEESVPSHPNFYPGGTISSNNNFFPIPQHASNHNINSHHHYPPEFPPEYSRMNYTGGGNNGNNNSCSSVAGDYFTGPASSNTRPSSSCPSYGHHHVSTPLEFQPHHLQSQQSFRRNSIESFSSDPGEGPFNPKYGYSGANVAPARNNSTLHLIKRESVIPSWSAEPPASCQDQQQGSDQYFFPGAITQYHRPPQSSSVHRCESVPQVHQIQHPPSSFEDGMTPVDPYKKVTGFKPRSQSVSYSRNFEPHHFRTAGSHYQQHQPMPGPSVHPLKEVPVSSGDLPTSQGQGFRGESACRGRTSSGSFNSTSEPTTMEIPLPSEGECDEEDEDAGMESDSSSSPSQKSSFTPASADCNQSDQDNISDIEEELKKEIQSVTTTTAGSTTGVDVPGEEGGPDESNDHELNSGQPSSCHSQPPLSDDPAKLNIDETELSNSSLTLFDSIALNTFDSPGPGDGGAAGGGGSSDMEEVDNQLTTSVGGRLDEEDLDDQDSSLSGLSSISSHQQPHLHHIRRPQSNSSTCGDEMSRSTSTGPQKIMKRSFSEADKELVINTTAITAAVLACSNSREIKVPKGWRREISGTANLNSSFVFYISPSDTKLRSMEEVKNYITSDGTCKCGLSCPLRLELAFSFDPKVTNSCEEETDPAGLVEDGGTRRACCNQKRKILLSEDSPLISSTRDDLGDSGDGELNNSSSGAKKRRTDSSLKGTTTASTSNATTTLGLPIKEESQSSSSSLIVIPKSSATPSTPVPFAQQSPDTTTQTPQRDMSPASSVSSETSVTLGSRSTNSTPTPVGIKTSPSTGSIQEKGQGVEFAWPVPPGTTSLVRPQTPPSGSSYWSSNTSPNARKSKNAGYQHHLISKSPSKRTASPCPNVDVRQIPVEQNQPPPPRQGARMSPISISISSPGASQLVQPPSVSLVPILSTPVSVGENQSGVTSFNTGYSISPVIPNQSSSVANTLQLTSILPSTSYCQDFIGGMGMPRLVNSTTPILSTGIQPNTSLPTSITISVVGQQGTTSPGILPKLVQKSNARTTSSSSSSGNTETSSEKSPLQLVQDVVDRFHTEGAPDNTPVPTIPAEMAPNPGSTKKETETRNENLDTQSLESKIMKIIADAASASGKSLPPIPESKVPDPASVLLKSDVGKNAGGIRCGVNLSMLPVSSVPMSLPFISSHQMSIQSLPQTIFTSNATTVTTSSNSNPNNLPVMTSNSILNCTPGTLSGNPLGINTSNTGISLNNGNQLILQQQSDPNNSSLRYPIFQTLQPIFLNPGGGAGPLLIPQGNDSQSFIQIDQNNQGHSGGDLLHQTMVLDPSSMSMCGSGNILGPGPKKKKKRLSKKQQQQQAQLQLQQQILLQQLFNHQQVQQQHVQAAQQQIPLLLPPSFNIGPQGFLQPMNMNMNMNFFPTPTILTLPNLILNPADGTLFIQQAGPQLSSAPQTAQIPTPMKIGGVPIQAAVAQSNSNILLPRKETVTLGASSSSSGPPLLLTSADVKSSGGEFGIDDSSRQNATPDSSTNDCQLGLVPSTPAPPPQASTPAPMTVSLPLGSSTNLQGSKKAPLKSKVVSSSTAATVHKRILPQKQILPKIDSTTPSVENSN